jgi:D-serine deaminase-like pyridoxal phosphate-dependent protein
MPAIGARVRYVPSHVCTAINLVDEMIEVRDAQVAAF